MHASALLLWWASGAADRPACLGRSPMSARKPVAQYPAGRVAAHRVYVPILAGGEGDELHKLQGGGSAGAAVVLEEEGDTGTVLAAQHPRPARSAQRVACCLIHVWSPSASVGRMTAMARRCAGDGGGRGDGGRGVGPDRPGQPRQAGWPGAVLLPGPASDPQQGGREQARPKQAGGLRPQPQSAPKRWHVGRLDRVDHLFSAAAPGRSPATASDWAR